MAHLLRKAFFLFAFLLTISLPRVNAQQKTFDYGLTLQGEAGSGANLPFWLYANRHGLIDINSPGGNAIFDFSKNLSPHHAGFDYGFGATFVSRYSHNQAFFFNQIYAVLSYGALQLKGGRYYSQIGEVDPNLSMGSLAVSGNASPLPKLEIGFLHYTDVPLTRGYLQFKAELAHGWFEEHRFIENPYLHQKYAYVRLGGSLPVNVYAGLVDNATWAGTSRTLGNLADSFSDYLRVFTARSGKNTKVFGDNIFRLGDHRGIWDFGFNVRMAGIRFHAYRQQIFNDPDGLKFKTPDGLSGLSIDLPNRNQKVVNKFVFEYLYTKNQSGPIPPNNVRGGPGGRDNYYENFLYRSGWTYHGRTIGNPLFLNASNPRLDVVAGAYAGGTTKNVFGVVNNRIAAVHFGFNGQLAEGLNYKLLATRSANSGTYFDGDVLKEEGIKTDFFSTPVQWSFLAQFTYQPFENLKLHASLGDDAGQLYDNTIGLLFGIELLGHSSF